MKTTKLPAEQELVAIIRTYNEVAEQLKRSHEVLAQEVCRLRDELHEKNLELARRERLAALGEMAAGVAHEIRNPLGAIGLYASLLSKDLQHQPKSLELVRRLTNGVCNMESIVGDILAFAGDRDPDLQPAMLGEIIDRALTQVRAAQESPHASLEVDSALQHLHIRCDANQIERVLINLVSNAFEAAGPQGQVLLRCGETASGKQRPIIIIDDNGPGVDQAMAQRIFNPFYSTKDTGTGLGLAIVHRIVDAHGGFVSVDRSKLGGASFAVVFPSTLLELEAPIAAA